MSYSEAQRAFSMGRLDHSRELISGVLIKKPNDVSVLKMAIQICLAQGDLSALYIYCKRILKVDPNDLFSQIHIGHACISMGRPEEILNICNNNSFRPELLFTLSVASRSTGNIDIARTKIKELQKIEGNTSRVQKFLIDIDLEESSDPSLGLSILEKYNLENMGTELKRFVHFKRAELLDKMGEYDQAFKEASLAHKNAPKIDIDIINKITETIISQLNEKLISSLPSLSLGDRFLTLIISSPRAGSSLLERLLNSHPSICGVGELSELTILSRRMHGQSTSNSSYPNSLLGVDLDFMRKLSMTSMARLKKIAQNKRRLVIKDLMQVRHGVLIKAFFKNSTVINLLRDKRDVAVSCWLSGLDVDLHSWTNDLHSISTYLLAHSRLSKHLENIQLKHHMNINYEDVILNPNDTLRYICKKMEVPWNDKILDIESRQNRLPTVQSRLVSSEITNQSIGRWKNYEKHLGSILEKLA